MHHILELNDEKIKIPFCEKGYVYATSISQKVNKLMSDYLRLKDTKNMIELISKEFTIPITKVIIIRKGGHFFCKIDRFFNKYSFFIYLFILVNTGYTVIKSKNTASFRFKTIFYLTDKKKKN